MLATDTESEHEKIKSHQFNQSTYAKYRTHKLNQEHIISSNSIGQSAQTEINTTAAIHTATSGRKSKKQ